MNTLFKERKMSDAIILTTVQAAKLLGVHVSRLSRAVWDERIRKPRQVGKGFLWSSADIERASWVLRNRNADDVLKPHKTTEM